MDSPSQVTSHEPGLPGIVPDRPCRTGHEQDGQAVSLLSMLLLCVIFALITLGFVVPCVIDIATTPRHHFGLPTKETWLVVAIAFWAFGAAAWLLAGRRDVRVQRLWFDATGQWAAGSE